MPRSAAEQATLAKAIRALAEISQFGIDTQAVQKEFVRLLHNADVSSLPPRVRTGILKIAQDVETMPELREQGSKQLVGAAGKAAYQSRIFRCLSDFEKCCAGHKTVICGSLLLVCVAQQLIPFAPKG